MTQFIKLDLVIGVPILINVANIQHVVQAAPGGKALVGVCEILVYKNDGSTPSYQVKIPFSELEKLLRPAGQKLELVQ